MTFDAAAGAGAGEITLCAFLHKDGQLVSTPTSASVTMYTEDPTSPLWTSVPTVDSNGVFWDSQTPFSVEADTNYVVKASIIYGGNTYVAATAFSSVD